MEPGRLLGDDVVVWTPLLVLTGAARDTVCPPIETVCPVPWLPTREYVWPPIENVCWPPCPGLALLIRDTVCPPVPWRDTVCPPDPTRETVCAATPCWLGSDLAARVTAVS